MLSYRAVLVQAAAFREQYKPGQEPQGVQAWLALADMLEALFPGGDPEAEWDASRMEEVGAVLSSHGLRPAPAVCAGCGHVCLYRPCTECGSDPMEPGDSRCVTCDGA